MSLCLGLNEFYKVEIHEMFILVLKHDLCAPHNIEDYKELIKMVN